MTFGKRLKEARKSKQLTQSQVADILGIDFTTISKYENNKSQPDNVTLQKLADLYDVSLDWLFRGSYSERKHKNGNKICIDGERVELTDDEAKHLKDSLEMYRLLKEKRERDKRKK